MLHLYGVMDSPLKHLFASGTPRKTNCVLFLGFTNRRERLFQNVAKTSAASRAALAE
jgi:hypothetical protein